MAGWGPSDEAGARRGESHAEIELSLRPLPGRGSLPNAAQARKRNVSLAEGFPPDAFAVLD
jgi:hypothetical protein